jgi:V/A-type H+/Na+-transporting ATPase subunit C
MVDATANITTIITTLGFPSVEAFIAALFLVLAVVAVIVVVSTIKPVLNLFPYTYPNARVRARAGRMFSEKEFSEIIEAENVEEIKNYLRGVPDYAKYIDQYPLEKALDSQLAESYDLIARIAPDNSKEVFNFLLKKWDIRNIKSIIIAKQAGLDLDETLNLIVPFGALTDKIDSLIESDTVNEVINGLEGTEYPKILEDVISSYNETGLLLPLESALDKYLLVNLLRSSATPEDDNTSLLHNYIGTMVDVANIKIILRAKAYNLKYDDIESYMISDGYQIRDWKLKELMEAEDVGSVISSLEGTSYAPILSEAMTEYTETSSMSSFENALDSHVYDTAKTISLKNQFGIGPMIGFLNKKEREIRNLKIIARGKREGGFSSSMIKEMLL